MLVICDYTSRYPEAILLGSIDAPHVVEELLKFLSGVGIAKEILTNQVSNFILEKMFLVGCYSYLRIILYSNLKFLVNEANILTAVLQSSSGHGFV